MNLMAAFIVTWGDLAIEVHGGVLIESIRDEPGAAAGQSHDHQWSGVIQGWVEEHYFLPCCSLSKSRISSSNCTSAGRASTPL